MKNERMRVKSDSEGESTSPIEYYSIKRRVIELKTSIGLVAHAEKALSEKWGYVWGTFGLVLTNTLFEQKLKQYPQDVGNYRDFIISNWLNKRTADCVGLIKAYMWWDDEKNDPIYNSKQDVDSDGMFNMAKEKGDISTLPEIPGICLWKKGHIGIYMGNGRVIEARGTKYGVIQAPLKGTNSANWTHWLKCPFIEYVKDTQPEHWAQKYYDYLINKGIVIHDKRFDDIITRGEMFALMARIMGYKE